MTPKTHYLFLRIIAAVSRAPGAAMSVRQIAKELNLEPEVVAHCIALHVHLERQNPGVMSLPLPAGYWVPRVDEIIRRAFLEAPGTP